MVDGLQEPDYSYLPYFLSYISAVQPVNEGRQPDFEQEMLSKLPEEARAELEAHLDGFWTSLEGAKNNLSWLSFKLGMLNLERKK